MRPQGNVFNYVQYFKYWIWENYSKDMIVGKVPFYTVSAKV